VFSVHRRSALAVHKQTGSIRVNSSTMGNSGYSFKFEYIRRHDSTFQTVGTFWLMD